MATQVTRYQFAAAILNQLGIDSGWKHTGAKRGLMAWAGAESGWNTPCDGHHGAKFNVWNTTLVLPGCTAAVPYNSVPVQNYLSALCGAEAVARTLQEWQPGYAGIVAELTKPFNSGRNVLHAVAESVWGTFRHPDGTPDYAYADAIWSTYKSNVSMYNAVLVG